jgi:hypothetical protein
MPESCKIEEKTRRTQVDEGHGRRGAHHAACTSPGHSMGTSRCAPRCVPSTASVHACTVRLCAVHQRARLHRPRTCAVRSRQGAALRLHLRPATARESARGGAFGLVGAGARRTANTPGSSWPRPWLPSPPTVSSPDNARHGHVIAWRVPCATYAMP